MRGALIAGALEPGGFALPKYQERYPGEVSGKNASAVGGLRVQNYFLPLGTGGAQSAMFQVEGRPPSIDTVPGGMNAFSFLL
jgi:hypothetical protein